MGRGRVWCVETSQGSPSGRQTAGGSPCRAGPHLRHQPRRKLDSQADETLPSKTVPLRGRRMDGGSPSCVFEQIQTRRSSPSTPTVQDFSVSPTIASATRSQCGLPTVSGSPIRNRTASGSCDPTALHESGLRHPHKTSHRRGRPEARRRCLPAAISRRRARYLSRSARLAVIFATPASSAFPRSGTARATASPPAQPSGASLEVELHEL